MMPEPEFTHHVYEILRERSPYWDKVKHNADGEAVCMKVGALSARDTNVLDALTDLYRDAVKRFYHEIPHVGQQYGT